MLYALYAVAIILLVVLAIAALAKKWIADERAYQAYLADKAELDKAIEAGDYNRIALYGERVRKYETANGE